MTGLFRPRNLAALGLVAVLVWNFFTPTFSDAPPLQVLPEEKMPPLSEPQLTLDPGDLRSGLEVLRVQLEGTDPPSAAAAEESSELQLPAPGTPMEQQVNELVAAAAAGNPNAACRLAIGGQRCFFQKRSEFFARALESTLLQGGNSSETLLVSGTADSLNRAEQGADFCSGFSSDQSADFDRAIGPALHRLSPRQKTLLAMLRPDGSLRRLSDLSQHRGSASGGDSDYLFPQLLSDYAYEFLLEGVRAADPLALEGMILIHSPVASIQESLDVRISLPNARMFVAYSKLYAQLFSVGALGEEVIERLTMSTARLSAEELAKIDTAVSTELKRWQRISAAAPLRTFESSDHEDPAFVCEP